MLRFMSHIRAKVAAYNTMPSWVVFLVKLLLDVSSNILHDQYQSEERTYNTANNSKNNYLFNIVLFQRLGCAINCVLLHVFRHVYVLDHSFGSRVLVCGSRRVLCSIGHLRKFKATDEFNVC